MQPYMDASPFYNGVALAIPNGLQSLPTQRSIERGPFESYLSPYNRSFPCGTYHRLHESRRGWCRHAGDIRLEEPLRTFKLLRQRGLFSGRGWRSEAGR